jgi:hypothetical protein
VAGQGLAARAQQVVDMESGVSAVAPLPVLPDRAKPGFQPAVTQASSISVSRDMAHGGASPRKLAIFGGAVFACVVLVALAGRMLARDGAAPAAASASDTPASAPPPGTPVPTADGLSSAPSPSLAPSTEPPSPAASLPVERTPPVRRTAPGPVHAAPAGTKDCNPPYYWDAAGKKHYKMNCL